MAITAARVLDEKSAHDVVVLEVGDALGVVEYFVLAHGNSGPHIKALVNDAEGAVAVDHGVSPLAIEGADDRTWVLLDFGGVAIHVFEAEARRFYSLERLWSDAPRIEWRPDAPADGDAQDSPDTERENA